MYEIENYFHVNEYYYEVHGRVQLQMNIYFKSDIQKLLSELDGWLEGIYRSMIDQDT